MLAGIRRLSFLPMPSDDVPLSHAFERPVVGRWFQWGEPAVLEWNVAHLPIPDLPPALAGLRIVQFTDLHIRGPWTRTYDELARRITENPPDLLLCTGDFVDNKRDHSAALPSLHRLLKSFQARLGVFGILGNHDRMKLEPDLRGTNVRLIGGQQHVIPVGDAAIELIGLPGARRKEMPIGWAESFVGGEERPAGSPRPLRIVLSHFPDHLQRTRVLRPDIFLAGHTHGGQVCLPGGIPIIKHDRLPRRLCKGVHRVGPTWLVVPRGIGTTTLPLRVFCPPEVMELKMQSAE